MGTCIDKLPHSCGTTKGLQVFADESTGVVNGYCFACNTFVPNPYGEEKTIDDVELPAPKTQAEIDAEMAEVSGFPVLDLPSRKLRASDLELFDVKIALSEEDGKTPYASYFPMEKDGQVTGYYVKTLGDRKFTWSIGDVKDCDPFGWSKALRSGAYRLIITEGLEDAVSVTKIYNRHMPEKDREQWMPAVISLKNGVNSVSGLAKHAKTISSTFREVVLCFDNDEAGKAATLEALNILPNATTVELPEKDANDCVIKGAMKAAFNALRFNSTKPKNSRVVNLSELHEEAREPTPFGELTWPFPRMQDLLRGIRYGETIYIGSGVKMGKSELLNFLAAHFIQQHKVNVFMAKPEEQNKDTYKFVAGKIAGKKFNDPSVEFDYEAYDMAGQILRDKLYAIDLYQHVDWDHLKQDIIYAAKVQQCKVVFIDPITNLTNGMDSGEANSKLQEIAQDLSALAKDLNVVIFVFCHLKASDGNLSKDARDAKYRKGQYYNLGNCPHEKGGDVNSNQFAGSRAMMRSCNLMIGLAGNKDSDLEENIRRMRWLSILEDRAFGNSEDVPIIYNLETTSYAEC